MAKKQKSRKNIIMRFCIFAFVIYSAVLLVDMQVTLAGRKQELLQLQTQYKTQRLENKEIERQLELGIDDAYIEKIAREKLGFVAPDERVFIDISGN